MVSRAPLHVALDGPAPRASSIQFVIVYCAIVLCRAAELRASEDLWCPLSLLPG